MKAVIETNSLRKAARRAAKVAAARSPIPILMNVRIEAAGDAITLTANNLEYAIVIEVPAVVGEPGSVCVDAHEFRAFTEIARDGSQTTIEMDGRKLKASAGVRRATFGTLPPEDLPNTPAPVDQWDTPAEDISKAMAFCLPAASIEEARYYLVGVFFGDGHAVATDSHVLHAYPIDAPGPAIIPSGHLAMIRDVLDIDGATFGATDIRWSASAPGITLAGKCIDGKFPDWRRIIPEFTPGAVTHRDELMGAVDAATLKRDGDVIIVGAQDAEFLQLTSSRGNGDGAADCEAAGVAEFRAVLPSKGIRATLGAMPVGDLVIDVCGTTSVRIKPSDVPDPAPFAVIMQMRG